MGACLTKPVEAVVMERNGTEIFQVGVAEMNGWRSSMEDSHLIHMRETWGYFGVFDGHGGDQCSKFVAPRMEELLTKDGCPKDDRAIKELILRVDKEFLDRAESSGSTATMCLVRKPVGGGKHKLTIINAGDSRVLLGTIEGKIVEGRNNDYICTDQGLTRDHKPDDPLERERIYRCGGTVESAAGGVARVNGNLAVSRGFGDAEYKQYSGGGPEDNPVTADPEIGHFECDDTDFVMLVCDGVSEGDFPNPSVVELAAKVLRETRDPALASKAVIEKALEANSKDNITCMIVLLQAGPITGKSIEFVPGPIVGIENNQFATAYAAMAKKAGLTMAQAAEMRYEIVQEKLADSRTPPSVAAELRDEIRNINCSSTTVKGSSERTNWFGDWLKQRSSSGGGGGGQSDLEMMRMMIQRPGGADTLMGLLNREHTAQEYSDDGRPVRAAALPVLRAAVEAHATLQWDARMEDLAEAQGTVRKDDPSDGTTQVHFPKQKGIVAWLPTHVLTDL